MKLLLPLFILLGCVGAFAAEPIPLHHWQLEPNQWTGRTLASGGLNAEAKVAPTFDGTALKLNGDNRVVSPLQAKNLPEQALSVAAWVRIDKGTKWGGILSYSQDNGSYEKGWLLGYNEVGFVFSLATGKGLRHLNSLTSFEAGIWYHVAATYDGAVSKLYVNGVKEAESAANAGKIDYPEAKVGAHYVLGAYYDKDEFFPMVGQIREARLYDSSLKSSAVEVLAGLRGKDTKGPIAFAQRPYVMWRPDQKAVVHWQASPTQPGDSFLHTDIGGTRVKQPVTEPASGEVLQLAPEQTVRLRLESAQRSSSPFEIDTRLNYAPRAGGVCVVLNPVDLSQARRLADEFKVLVICADEALRRRFRAELYRDGLLGHRISLFEADALATLPPCSANLVTGTKPDDLAPIERILTPGGKAVFGAGSLVEKTPDLERPPLPGAGSWTHQYGNAGNATYTGEMLGGAKGTDDFALQWIGRPGGDFGIDRNPRMPAPLAINGRVFHQGLNRMIALDAFNGSVLWQMEVPDLRRVNMPRDSGNWCADEDFLYVAVKDQLWWVPTDRGGVARSIRVPGSTTAAHAEAEWGFLANAGSRVFGTRSRAESSFRGFWSKASWYDSKKPDAGTAKVCSDTIFAVDKQDGALVWEHRGGVIINSAIAVADDKVFFVECRNPAIAKTPTRRIGSPDLWKDLWLMALDAETGKMVWEHGLTVEPGGLCFYLQSAEGTVLLMSSEKDFRLYGFDAADGSERWRTVSKWPDDHHSGHLQHPVIVNGRFYLQPRGFDLQTGNVVTEKVGARSGCHTYVGAGKALIYRGSGRRLAMWDIENESVSVWDRLRPSCWLSVVPANGMLQVPEGGAGCSCGGWMETSMSFLPKTLLLEPRLGEGK